MGSLGWRPWGRTISPTSYRSPFEFDGAYLWVGGSGESVLRTRKVSNVRAGRRKVALVVDDLPSFDPFVARGIRVYGTADGPVQRTGAIGPGLYLRITPHVSWSWNLAGKPVGATWYESRRAVHDRFLAKDLS